MPLNSPDAYPSPNIMHPQQQHHPFRQLSISSYIKLSFLILLHLLFTYFRSPTITQLTLTTVTVLFPATLSAYVVRRHRDRKVRVDDLVSHYVFGAVVWYMIYLVIWGVAANLIIWTGILHKCWHAYKIEPKHDDFLEVLDQVFKEIETTGKEMQNASHSNPDKTQMIEYLGEFLDNFYGFTPMMVFAAALINAISTYYLARRSLSTIITVHNTAEPIGVRVIFNYTIMGVLGFCTMKVLVNPPDSYVRFLDDIVYVIVLTGAAMIVAFEYVKFLCFKREKRIVRAVAMAFMYLLCDQVLTDYPGIMALKNRKMQPQWLPWVIVVARSAFCGVVTNVLREKYITILSVGMEGWGRS